MVPFPERLSALLWEYTWQHHELFTLNARSKTPRLALQPMYTPFGQCVHMAHPLALISPVGYLSWSCHMAPMCLATSQIRDQSGPSMFGLPLPVLCIFRWSSLVFQLLLYVVATSVCLGLLPLSHQTAKVVPASYGIARGTSINLTSCTCTNMEIACQEEEPEELSPSGPKAFSCFPISAALPCLFCYLSYISRCCRRKG